jgi:hypothetical protein
MWHADPTNRKIQNNGKKEIDIFEKCFDDYQFSNGWEIFISMHIYI